MEKSKHAPNKIAYVSNWNARLHIPCRRINNNRSSGVNGENISHFAWAHKFNSHTHAHTFLFLWYHFSLQSSSFFSTSKLIASSCHISITIADMLNYKRMWMSCFVVVVASSSSWFSWMNSHDIVTFIRLHNVMLEKCCTKIHLYNFRFSTCSFFSINSRNNSLELVCARSHFLFQTFQFLIQFFYINKSIVFVI